MLSGIQLVLIISHPDTAATLLVENAISTDVAFTGITVINYFTTRPTGRQLMKPHNSSLEVGVHKFLAREPEWVLV